MKAVESFACTGGLPTARVPSGTGFTAASSLRIVRTISTSFMSGTGLKKCTPSTCPGRLVAAAIAVTLHDDVLEARIVAGGQIRSSLAKVSFLSAWFSVIASTTRSAVLRSSSRVVPAMRPSVSSFVFASSLPLATNPSSVWRSRSRPRFTSSSLASTNSTLKPAWAETCTMPEPMRPQPITPTFLMAMRSFLWLGVAELLRATAGQRRRLVVRGAGRAGIAHGDRQVAVADTAVLLHLAKSATHRGGAFGAQRLLIGGVTALCARRREVEEHRRADRRLQLLGGGAAGGEGAQQRGGGHGDPGPALIHTPSTGAAGKSSIFPRPLG